MLRAVLFDVDFTIARPGPELGPEGYQRLGARFGLELDPSRYREARERAIEGIKRHPELEHDEEIWVAFTERIIRNMGGDADSAYDCAVAMTRAWERAEHFELYEDAPPVLEELRSQGLKLGLVSNTGRNLDEFIAHHRLQVDAALGSGAFGRTKPHPTIFRAVLERLGVEPADAAMVGDSPERGSRPPSCSTGTTATRSSRTGCPTCSPCPRRSACDPAERPPPPASAPGRR
jgi:HAD superfamily hydrolase (TIGR01549 family)